MRKVERVAAKRIQCVRIKTAEPVEYCRLLTHSGVRGMPPTLDTKISDRGVRGGTRMIDGKTVDRTRLFCRCCSFGD